MPRFPADAPKPRVINEVPYTEQVHFESRLYAAFTKVHSGSSRYKQ